MRFLQIIALALLASLVPSAAMAQEQPAPFWAAQPPQPAPATDRPAPAARISSTTRAPRIDQEAARSAYTLGRGPDQGWVVVGAVTLVLGYLGGAPFVIGGLTYAPPPRGTFSPDRTSCNRELAGWSFLPLVGTLVGGAHWDSCSETGALTWLGLLPVAVQLFGVAAIVGGLLANVETGEVVVAGHELRLLPYARDADMGLSLALSMP